MMGFYLDVNTEIYYLLLWKNAITPAIREITKLG